MPFGRYGVRATVSRAFHRFGNHCANHQIRVILISCVVITSLIYPALALHSSSKPISHLSSKWLHAVFGSWGSPKSTSTTDLVGDLNGIWSGFGNLVADTDSIIRARCSQGPTIRLERLLIFRDAKSEYGALERDTLLDGLRIQKKINDILINTNNPLLTCLRDSDGQCFVLSPLSYWNYEESHLTSTIDVTQVINQAKGPIKAGVHITPDMVFSDRSSGSFVNKAKYLVFSYFFHDEDCTGNQQHSEWIQLLERLRSKTVSLKHGTEGPSLVALQYDPTPGGSFSILRTCLYLAYIAFFIYFSGSLQKMDTVHSRWGLAFTGLVEIVASTFTSISVCAIVNFTLRTVPWSIFPVIIVFVGAENMFNLVDAVVKTSVTLPVRERIGVGLSQAGTSNTFKVVTYNSILGVIAALSPPGPIQEFCVFAIVVLVAHWFLIHTFFVAVLAIDLQRLELTELLSQDASLQPQNGKLSEQNQAKAKGSVLGETLQKWKRGRVARNLSLLLLLAFTALLYYITLPPMEAIVPDSGSVEVPSPAVGDGDGAAWKVWTTLNPGNHNFLHIRTESPSVITLLSPVPLPRPRFRRTWLLSTITQLRPVFCAVNLVVFPIAATTGLLYLLLLYLLKNKELLDARHSGDVVSQQSEALSKELSFASLPQLCRTDIQFMVANDDGSVVVIVSVDDEVLVWRQKGANPPSVQRLDIIEALGISISSEGVVQAMAIDTEGTCIALGSSTDIAIWGISSRKPFLVLNQTVPSPVSSLSFSAPPTAKGAIPPSRNSVSSKPAIRACLQDGSVFSWPLETGSLPSKVIPSHPSSGAVFLNSPGDSETWISCFTETGLAELMRFTDNSWTSVMQMQAGNICDPVARVCILKTGFIRWIPKAAACVTQSGVITVWDLDSGDCLHIFDSTYDHVGKMELSPIPGRPCPSCNKMKQDALALCFSTGEWCHIFQIKAEQEGMFTGCSCSSISPPVESVSKGILSRRGSVDSPQRKRAQIQDSLAPFPVSGHGVHSRRVTSSGEKELPRPTLEINSLSNGTLQVDTGSNGHRFAPRSPLLSPGSGAMCRRVAALDVVRGKWTLVNGVIVGVRHRETPQGRQKGNSTEPDKIHGSLPPSVLRKWEAFRFDLIEKSLVLSDLQSLSSGGGDEVPFSPTKIESHNYPRLPFTRISCLSSSIDAVAFGLGNTPAIIKFRKAVSSNR